MIGIAMLSAAMLAAQPAPALAVQPHQHQEQAPNHSASDARCCCEEMMQKMMTEMMQKHQGMGMQHPSTTQQHPKPEDQKR